MERTRGGRAGERPWYILPYNMVFHKVIEGVIYYSYRMPIAAFSIANAILQSAINVAVFATFATKL